MKEQWMPVVGYEDIYEISSIGRCRRSGKARGARIGHILKPFIHRATGYFTYSLCLDSQNKTHSAHRLVAGAFLGPIPKGQHVNHKNGVRTNNRVENLEVVTCAENNLHAYRVLGRKSVMPGLKGSKHPMSKLKEENITTIKSLSANGMKQNKIAQKFGVDRALISLIVNNKIWKHITGASL